MQAVTPWSDAAKHGRLMSGGVCMTNLAAVPTLADKQAR